ncbi:ArgK/MeaB family GTPase [Amorphus orientalis]|uniref:LAO/AO transport system kinase n=1 Tax=Amorphus orientalis TaxID=649198 RepID=A0AAE3VPN4_9HYPH|nr:methylmalonyl Co-A mutase-associated GTPase MeaB [Amorphus orientalis]MDQ0315860.1 LAO/AO transport system kinase [Amorphus orientalis]
MATDLTLDAIRDAGKAGVARALAAVERRDGAIRQAALLDAALRDPKGLVLGLTGPPGVGKSTLTNVLIADARARGRSVAVIAVDPSSRRTMGALLGDRTRLRTNPDDDQVFVRSFAARDRLGGLSDSAIAATVLMRALFDLVIVETVGIGQSEADIALVADTVVLCVQPGSGDSLQFMKAGVMELPDVVAVTKADLGAPAKRARADVEGALSLAAEFSDWHPRVLTLSATTASGLEALHAAVDEHQAWLAEEGRLAHRRREQEEAWVVDAVRDRFGTAGLALWSTIDRGAAAASPFRRIAEASATLGSKLDPG